MSNFEARYGRAKRSQRDRRIVVVLASVLATALVAWIFTVVFFAPPKVSGVTVGFVAASEYQASVKAQITAPVGASVICGVGAVNPAQETVGYRQLEFTATKPISQFTVLLNTTHEATSGVVTDCKLR